MEKGLSKMAKEIVKAESVELATNIDFDVKTGYINTFDMSTIEGKMDVINAVNSTESLNAHVGEVLKINNCITMPGIRKGRNGAPDTECQNTILVDVDGISYFSQSDGVARDICLISSVFPDFGKNSNEGYLKLVCISKDLPNGNSLKSVVIKND